MIAYIMTIRYFVSKIPSRCSYHVRTLLNNDYLSTFQFCVHGMQTTINNIEIAKSYRGQGWGKRTIIGIEDYVKRNYKVDEIHLLAWQPSGGTEVIDFYKKLGYKEGDSVHGINKFDDSIVIYDLYPFSKRL